LANIDRYYGGKLTILIVPQRRNSICLLQHIILKLAAMPPDESFWKYVTSATELLGTDEGNPVIGSAPIYVASSSDEEGTDYAALIKKSVRREELLALLEGASPVRGMNAFAIYAWHGVRVPQWIIEQPDEVS
jgi:hypothetical protein